MSSSHQPSEQERASPSESSGNTSEPFDLLVSQRTRNGIAITITAVWAIGIIADAVSAAFELSPYVYMTMIGLATTIFGSNFMKGIKQ